MMMNNSNFHIESPMAGDYSLRDRSQESYNEFFDADENSGDFFEVETNNKKPSSKLKKNFRIFEGPMAGDYSLRDPPQTSFDEYIDADDNSGDFFEIETNNKEPSSKLKNIIHLFRQLCGKIINNDKVQYIILIMITVNAIMMGIGTYDFVSDNERINNAFELTDLAFLWIFTIELFLQFIYHGFKLFYDGWLVFDLVIVVMSWSFQSMQIIRAFRILRALRLITRVQDLRNLVIAVIDSLPRLAAIILLLVLVFYIFAVMFTNLFKDLYVEADTEVDYFGRLDLTLYTLFVMITMEWADTVRITMTVYPWAWAPFMFFLTISGFIVCNLIVAVIVDSVTLLYLEEDEDADEENDEDLKRRVVKAMSNLDRLNENQDAIKESLEVLAELIKS